MSLFLLSIVDEDDLCKFGRIGLEIILPSPLNDMVDLSLSAAVVCGRDDDVRVVSELDEFVPIYCRSDCFQICSTDHVRRRGTKADPWMMLAVISSTDDFIPWYRVQCE